MAPHLETGFWLSRSLGHILGTPGPQPVVSSASPAPPTTTLNWLGHLTSHSLAAVGVTAAGGVALHTQTLVAAVGVDAALAAGEGGAALIHISTSAAVILRPEAGSAAALQAQGALAGDGAGVWASP